MFALHYSLFSWPSTKARRLSLFCRVTESRFCEDVRRTLCQPLALGCILAIGLSRQWHCHATFGLAVKIARPSALPHP